MTSDPNRAFVRGTVLFARDARRRRARRARRPCTVAGRRNAASSLRRPSLNAKMVKIVELDETETHGLASAGIGLAGSELPNKRKKKKARPPLDPLGGLAGMGAGTGTGGSSRETGSPALDEAEIPPRPFANPETIGASASVAPGGVDKTRETIETRSTKKAFFFEPSAAAIVLTVLSGVATFFIAFYVSRALARTRVAPREREL